MGLGKCYLKMGVVEKKQAILLLGASGGVGANLLEYLSSRTILELIPSYNKNLPVESQLSWIQYNSLNFEVSRLTLEKISKQYEIAIIVDATGTFFGSKIKNSTAQEINEVISTNLVAPLMLAKHAQEFMGVGGKIIFMSSIVSTMQLMGSSAYAASKAGLEQGVISLSSEFAKTGHGICAVRLGYMDYGMTYKINEKFRREIVKNLAGEKFINIEILGERILEIIKSKVTSVNGKIYEVT